MISVDELKQALQHRAEQYNHSDNPLTQRSVKQVPLLDALNCVLAQDIYADFDIPRQHLSAMDGFALAAGSSHATGSSFDIVGESGAGQPYQGAVQVGQAVRIFTGAVLPMACETVVMQEHTDFDPQHSTDKSTSYTVKLTQAARQGGNIRRQGEEVQAGEKVLTRGTRLNPSDISLLANLGVAQLAVYAPLVVGLIATGDELIELGQPLQQLAHIYNSNTPTLKSLLSDMPVHIRDYGIIADDLAQTRQIFEQAIDQCDVIVSSAGVSVGDYDFLTMVTTQLGKINHYKVAMKPGKPFVFGEFRATAKNRTVLYFGLPGNPLSTVVCCLNFVKPTLWQISGVNRDDQPQTLRLQATVTHDIKKQPGRQDYQRAIFSQQVDGQFVVTALSAQDSHRVKQLSQANCLLVLPQESRGVSAGETVKIEPFSWCWC